MLPFDEVIDWTQASLELDERRLLQVGHMTGSVCVLPHTCDAIDQGQVVPLSQIASIIIIAISTIASTGVWDSTQYPHSSSTVTQTTHTTHLGHILQVSREGRHDNTRGGSLCTCTYDDVSSLYS